MKKTLVTVAAIGLLAVSLGAKANNWKEIRFGVDTTYAPFEYKAPNGQIMGFDIDLGNELCKRLKAKCQWVESDFDSLIPGLKAKKFDGIISSLSITEARMKEINFSDKLFDAPSRMVAKKGTTLQPTVASLKGKRVGVLQGTTQETYAKKVWGPAGVKVVPYQTQDLVFSDLAAGRLDSALSDAVQAQEGFLKKSAGKNFAFAGDNLKDDKIFGTGTGVGLRKEDSALRTAINQALADMHKDGTYQKLAKKYFNFDIYGKK